MIVGIDAHWNIANYLPREIGESFTLYVSDFVFQIYQIRARHEAAASAAGKKDIAALEAADLKTLIAKTFTQKMLKVVPDMRRHFSSRNRDRYWFSFPYCSGIVGLTSPGSAFPVMPGSYLPMTDPSLEFVKMFCHVLGLETQLESEVARLKGSLTRLLSVGEFSQAAEFHNPCMSFVLPDVVCAFCNASQDIDLCRDELVLSNRWECPQCSHPFGKSAIEGQLQQVVERRLLSYQMQDLVCVKCASVKDGNLRTVCQCSGGYQNSVSPADMRAWYVLCVAVVSCLSSSFSYVVSVASLLLIPEIRLQVMLSIAKFHEFGSLAWTVEWILSG